MVPELCGGAPAGAVDRYGLRALVRQERSPRITLELGGEVAYNMLDTEQALTVGGVVIPLQCETLSHRGVGQLLDTRPERLVEKAIVGMLPHTKLSRQVQKKLKVYAGPNHPHTAQQPKPFEIKQVAQ